MSSELTDFLKPIFGDPKDIAEIEGFWADFKPYADPDFVEKFRTSDEEARQQKYWELWLGAYLIRRGIKLNPNRGKGPDFSFQAIDTKVHIEAISPGPGKGSNQVPKLIYQELGTRLVAQTVPSREMLLRHTTAIQEKIDKFKKYQEMGIAGPTDALVIALDSSQVGHWGFEGISGYPTAVEAVYPVGPQQVSFPLGKTGEATWSIQYRPEVNNANGAPVSTTQFLNPDNSLISGIIAGSQNMATRINPPKPLVMIHNKLATKSIFPSPVPVDEEYYLEEVPTGYRIAQRKN